MEAVPATSGARRTVRLAAALVIGQVLLVAIVGWVTLTRGDSHPARGASAIDQLAVPPAHASPIPPAPPATSSPTATKKTPATRKTSPAEEIRGRTVGPRTRPGGTGATARRSGSVPAAPAPTTSTSSGPLALVPTSSPAGIPPSVSPVASPSASASASPTASPSAQPGPVRAGEPCDRINAVAQADDGSTVLCRPNRFNQLRWKIV